MNRKEFFQNSLIVGGATILPSGSLFAESVVSSGFDKLTDKDGNFDLQQLPYAENYLEPVIDALFPVINWDNVALRLDNALKLTR